jgi:hypothetical protein
MSKTKIAALVLLLSGVTVADVYSTPAAAQATFADKAVSRLVGAWISARGRSISFQIRDGSPIFQDEVEPNVTLTGSYRQDDAGAGYVLRYVQGFECRYNIAVIGAEGDEINLRLVSAYEGDGKRFTCLQGSLKRTRQR